MTQAEYIAAIEDVLEWFKDLIQTIDADAEVSLRYITSVGDDDEQWLGYLRDADGNVNRWLVTLRRLTGLPLSEKGTINGFNKPLVVSVEYLADYQQGTDLANTEVPFRAKMLALDYLFETNATCGPNGLILSTWQTDILLRQFSSATVHWGRTTIELRLDDITY